MLMRKLVSTTFLIQSKVGLRVSGSKIWWPSSTLINFLNFSPRTHYQQQHTPSKLMPLRPRPNLLKLPLRYPCRRPPQPAKQLRNNRTINIAPHRSGNQSLGLNKTRRNQMLPENILHMPKHEPAELPILVPPTFKNLVHKPAPHQLRSAHFPARKQRLVRFPYPHPPHEPNRRAALGDQTQAGERCEEVSVRDGVDEIRKGNQRRGDAYYGPVQGRYEDFRVRVEGLRQVKVVCYCFPEAVAPEIGAFWGMTGD